MKEKKEDVNEQTDLDLSIFGGSLEEAFKRGRRVTADDTPNQWQSSAFL